MIVTDSKGATAPIEGNFGGSSPIPASAPPSSWWTEIKEVWGDDPPVVVQPMVKQGSPAKVLIEQSANADLLVVGTRGHGGFRGLVLGWVSHHVAGYAQCSVTIVR